MNNAFVFVSAIHGNSSNTGEIDSPLDTFVNGATLAGSNATTDLKPWGVYVMAGDYNETIRSYNNSYPLPVILAHGAKVAPTSGPAVDDQYGAISLKLMRGCILFAANNSPTIAVSLEVILDDVGDFYTASNSPSVNVTGGLFEARNSRIGSDSNGGYVISQSDGEVRLVNCDIKQSHTDPAIWKEGGEMKLHHCRIQSAGSFYASSPSAQSIQVFGCVSNRPEDTDITETIGTMHVDSDFVL
jgi:hypothetical protein